MSGGTADRGGYSLLVLSLSSDRNALALGPQIAAFAASLGILTVFTPNMPTDAEASAALRAACAAAGTPMQNGNLLLVGDDGNGLPRARLTVIATAVDPDGEQLPGMARTATAAVLGASAGAASAEQLARAAAAAADTGTVIAGIIVANPDPDDKTTGLVPRPVRPMRSVRGDLPTKHENAREERTGDRTRPADWATYRSR